jgi:uncharacterized membrane protein YfcA
MLPSTEFLTFAAVGALAQLVDGALGMAYGVASATMLLGLGVPPVTATASVHQAEAFTCGASGLSHWLAGNVRWPLFWVLAVPGVVGAVAGAAVVVHVPAAWMRLALTPYLLGMGVFLLWRAPGRQPRAGLPRGTPVLGLAAGFADAVAGGGWSALAVTTLVARGATPRMVIGTVHLAKCVVSVAASASFLLLVGLNHRVAVLGLIAGGVMAAPMGALFARRMPARVATALAAIAVLGLGVSNVVKAFG